MPLHVRKPEGFVIRWFNKFNKDERLIVTLAGNTKAVFVTAPERLSTRLGANFLILDREASDPSIVRAMDLRKPSVRDVPIPSWKRLRSSKSRKQWEESVDVAVRPMINYRYDSFGSICYELYIGDYLPIEFVVDRRLFISYNWVSSQPGVKEILQSDDLNQPPRVIDVQVTTAP